MNKTITIKDDGKLKTSELYAKILKKYPNSWKYWDNDDLDKYCPQKVSERTFLDSNEPEINGKSWDNMQSEGKLGDCMTVREYMIMTLEHGLKDIGTTWTRFSDSFTGGIAVGCSRGGGFGLNDHDRDGAGASGGFRAVVNLESLPFDTSLENAVKICKQAGYKIIRVETITKEIEI